ncbi:hypothetical protein H310_01044 [Aphanomyces invadans]|uniref:AMP-dependent synthetase/ligase domain-containing protein n=1 Tax=Aphanomyces invadans TaxID=157072 RepID=A0A024URJ1_9STRA|nr:hypothetical protein H310_01044 [Aphanomyces invadans]ETW08467.1 hypothetical protein H310_01044 [Aphanomyces invadans]|eukprot:XP_008862272.1 hypothetical protein H310_01044 [Aphanomyces invadans]
MATDFCTKAAAIAVGAATAAYVDKKLYLSHDLMKYWGHSLALVQTRYLIARNTRVADLWEELVDAMPSKVLVMFEGKKYTAVQLEIQANRVAHWAMSVGLTPGSIVALLMENRPEFLATWIGLSKVGVVAALINTHVAEEGLLHCLRVSDASVIIFGAECTAQVEHVLDRLPPRITRLAVYHEDGTQVPPPLAFARSLNEDVKQVSSHRPLLSQRKSILCTDMMLLIFTSGTTGLPKAARIEHQSLISRSMVFVRCAQITRFDRFYCSLPLYHTAGGVVAVGIMLLSGCSISLARKFSTTHFWSDVRATEATIVQYIGEMCRYLLHAPPSDLDRANVVRVAIGNGLRPDIWSAFQDRFGIPVVCEFYGATEGVGGMLNVCRERKDRGHLGQYGYLATAISGMTIVEYDVDADELLRDTNNFLIPCATGRVGELLIKVGASSPLHKFQGYFKDDAASAKKLLANAFTKASNGGDLYFRTGDLFRMDTDRCFYFMDRIGDTFRWNGENVATSEVAEALSAFPGISDICVYGVALPGRDGRAGMAAMVFKDLDMEAFAKFCTSKLPLYAVPRFLRQLRAMHVTGTMKHEKAKLRKQGIQLDQVGLDRLYFLDRSDPLRPKYLPLTPSNVHEITTASRL